MSNKKSKIFGGLFVITIFVILGYSAVFGRLLPYSPIIVGFEKIPFSRAKVYYHKGYKLPSLDEIDIIIEKIEEKHGLKYSQKVDIILCKTDREKKRLTGSLTRAQSFFIFGRIVVSRKLQNEAIAGKKPFGVYLGHELSHSLTHQNLPLFRIQAFPPWLDEGLAVYSANQFGEGGYFTKLEVYKHIEQGYFFYPMWWNHPWQKSSKESREFQLENKYNFIYSEFGCIVDDLIKTYSRELFDKYYHHLLKDGKHEEVFKSVFVISFAQYLDDFRNRVLRDIQ